MYSNPCKLFYDFPSKILFTTWLLQHLKNKASALHFSKPNQLEYFRRSFCKIVFWRRPTCQTDPVDKLPPDLYQDTLVLFKKYWRKTNLIRVKFILCMNPLFNASAKEKNTKSMSLDQRFPSLPQIT